MKTKLWLGVGSVVLAGSVINSSIQPMPNRRPAGLNSAARVIPIAGERQR